METISEADYRRLITHGIPFKGYVIFNDGRKVLVDLRVQNRVTISQGEYEQKVNEKKNLNQAVNFLDKSLYGSSIFTALGQYTHPTYYGNYYNYLGKLHPLKGGIPYDKLGNAIMPSNLPNYSKHARGSISNYSNWAKASTILTAGAVILEGFKIISTEFDDELPREEKSTKHIKSGVNITFSVVSMAGPIGAGVSIIYFSVDIIFGEENKGGWETIHNKAKDTHYKAEMSLRNWVYSWFYNAFRWM